MISGKLWIFTVFCTISLPDEKFLETSYTYVHLLLYATIRFAEKYNS